MFGVAERGYEGLFPMPRAAEYTSVTAYSPMHCSPKAMVWVGGSPLGTFPPDAPKGDAYYLLIIWQIVFMLSPICECPKIFAQKERVHKNFDNLQPTPALIDS